MKLLNFVAGDRPSFGLAAEGFAFSFEALRERAGADLPDLDSIDSYLENLPASFAHASDLQKLALDLSNQRRAGAFPLSEVRILPPIPRPAALFDFGLTPKHLIASARTLLKHEWGPLAARLLAPLLSRGIRRRSRSEVLPYYKGNPLTVIGDGDEIGWPEYTSYLDIEPELAVVTGTAGCPIAGYLIFNDASARDVQFPEMTGTGPARSKDFARGNGLGPYLVTPDEVPDPLSLEVTVKIGNRFTWRGSTSEYTVHPAKVIDYCRTLFPLVPGIVVGMGTVPGCTGLDNDLWVDPGERIAITIGCLGTLHQRIPEKPKISLKSRWRSRPGLP